jgi:hypothetical protein
VDGYAEEYSRTLDAAWRVADAAGMAAGADLRAYLVHMDTITRARVLEEATRRRDQEVLLRLPPTRRVAARDGRPLAQPAARLTPVQRLVTGGA